MKLAIVGLGMAVAPHARSLLDLADRAEVVWAASRSEERCRAFAERFSFPVTADVGRAIMDDRVEAVILLTPPASHHELGSAILRAGKHLLIEKPVGLTTRETEDLVQLAARMQRRMGVVLQHRFRPASVELARLIASGSLGPLCAGQCTVPWWRPQSYYNEPGRGTLARDGGGVLVTQAIHTLDLLRALVGTVEVIAAHTTTTALHSMETEDYAAALVKLCGHAPGTIVATTAFYPGFPERIELAFAKATARLEGNTLELFHHDGRQERFGEEQTLGSGADPMAFPHDAHRALITDFLTAVEENRDPLVSGTDIVATRRLLDAILA